MPTYVFRVRILGGFHAPPGSSGIWREVELAGDQTLAEHLEQLGPPAEQVTILADLWRARPQAPPPSSSSAPRGIMLSLVMML
jgi:hypothetical protein